jgi:uncharacterized protein YndB with AHSA1/START domain
VNIDAGRTAIDTPGLDLTAIVDAPVGRVLQAFFDADALRQWWQVTHSVTTPRVLGPYAIEWDVSEFRDEILGRLGGVFRGTIMQFDPGSGFFVADAFWLPPDGDPIGPMTLEVTCTPMSSDPAAHTQIRVRQSGFEESVRWRRYYEVVPYGWERALASLKSLLES